VVCLSKRPFSSDLSLVPFFRRHPPTKSKLFFSDVDLVEGGARAVQRRHHSFTSRVHHPKGRGDYKPTGTEAISSFSSSSWF